MKKLLASGNGHNINKINNNFNLGNITYLITPFPRNMNDSLFRIRLAGFHIGRILVIHDLFAAQIVVQSTLPADPLLAGPSGSFATFNANLEKMVRKHSPGRSPQSCPSGAFSSALRWSKKIFRRFAQSRIAF